MLRSEYAAHAELSRASDTRERQSERDAMIARIWGEPVLMRARQSKGEKLARETLRAIFKFGAGK